MAWLSGAPLLPLQQAGVGRALRDGLVKPQRPQFLAESATRSPLAKSASAIRSMDLHVRIASHMDLRPANADIHPASSIDVDIEAV